jgi:di/tricarboxylate transporter
MNTDQIIVILTIVFIIIALYKELMRPPVTFLVAIVVLNIFGILSPKDILAGFSNEQIAVITLLLIIGDLVESTNVLDRWFDRIFRKAKTYNGFLIRMMAYVATASAFFNNTPLVAMLMPYTFSWSKRNQVVVSKLLIPLSYAAILGGAATLIGTSTNLIVGGLVSEAQAEIEIESIGIFDLVYVGVPMIVIGILYILLVGKHLLPINRGVMFDFRSSKREYVVETKVKEDSRLIGKTVSEAGLRNLTGLFLVEIIRGEEQLSPVKPEDRIQSGDHLIFAGETTTVADLIDKDFGLSLPKNAYTLNDNGTGVVEAVIPFNSNLIGKKIRESDFRSRFDASILAVHRNGEKLAGRIGDIVLKSGDLLLLIGGKEVFKRIEGYNVFYILSQVKQISDVKKTKVIIVLVGLFAAIILSSLKIVSLFIGLLVLLAFMFISKMITMGQLKKSTRFNIVMIAGLALALGKAMMITGTADYLAEGVVAILAPHGILVTMFGIYLVTNILAGYMTNVAAVSIIFPIVLSTSIQLGVNPTPFILLIAFASSANFFTPVGYQTNLMVYSAGEYKFNDFLKIGVPLSLIYMVVAVLVLYYMYQL